MHGVESVLAYSRQDVGGVLLYWTVRQETGDFAGRSNREVASELEKCCSLVLSLCLPNAAHTHAMHCYYAKPFFGRISTISKGAFCNSTTCPGLTASVYMLLTSCG